MECVRSCCRFGELSGEDKNSASESTVHSFFRAYLSKKALDLRSTENTLGRQSREELLNLRSRLGVIDQLTEIGHVKHGPRGSFPAFGNDQTDLTQERRGRWLIDCLYARWPKLTDPEQVRVGGFHLIDEPIGRLGHKCAKCCHPEVEHVVRESDHVKDFHL
jgi:hypothetical protein